MEWLEGGVCAPLGFVAGGIHCGVRKSQEKKDLGMIVSEVLASAAGVYTQNKVQGAPVVVTREHLSDGQAQAVICNSGIANTCAADGLETAKATCEAVAKAIGILPQNVIVASTGVIGVSLPMAPILSGIPPLASSLSREGHRDFAAAIMTTDTVQKEVAVRFTVGGIPCTLGGAAKGSGMIHPNMATMLSFLTTDAAISSLMLEKALREVVELTFNMVSVDGDTSTNDTLTILANGLAGNPPITSLGEDYEVFLEALLSVCTSLSKMLAKDGEGATKLVECEVLEAPDAKTAGVLAKAVIGSSLVKAAMFGADANWGRVLCALGYAVASFDIHKVEVRFFSSSGSVTVCQNGAGISFSEELAKNVLQQSEVCIVVNLHQGTAMATAWGCDLTYDYVKINGDYRS